MTAVEALGSVDELADWTDGSVDAVTGAAIGPYWKSRMTAAMWVVVAVVALANGGQLSRQPRRTRAA